MSAQKYNKRWNLMDGS